MHSLLRVVFAASILSLAACGDSGGRGTNPISVGGSSGGSGTSGGGSTGGGGPSPNSAPTANNDVALVQANSSNNPVDVLANDSDPDGDTLTIVSATAPKAGTTQSNAAVPELFVTPDGKLLRFTPPPGFIGVQPIVYTVSDGNGNTAQATALITVSPIAVPPAAVPDAFTLNNDGNSADLNVLANDIDGAGGGLTLSSVSATATVPPGAAGSLSIVNDRVRYTPRAGFTGVETFSYVLTDANGATANGLVVVTVLPLAAPPVAIPDIVSTTPGASVLIPVLANDVDLSGSGLTVTSAASTLSVPPLNNGTFTVDGDRVRYTPPDASFVGVQTATYSIADGNGSAATGLITVVVSPIALSVPPIAVGDIATLNSSNTSATLNVLANDIDPSGTGLTVSAVDVIAGLPTGNITATTNGITVTITPPAGYVGVITLSYTITDGAGQTSVAPIVVTVAPIALPPVAVPDVAVLPQGAADVVLDVRANDLDSAGGGLELTAASLTLALPPEAGLSVRVEGGNVVLSRPASYFGIVTLGYTVTDANGQSAPGVATVTITPAALSLPPLAVPDAALVTQGAADVVLNVRSNDIDTSGSGLTLSAASLLLALPMDAGITVAIANNELRVTRPASYAGVITVNYTVTDGNGMTGSSLATITVSPLALAVPPIAVPDVQLAAQGSSPISVNVLANDIDPSGGGLTLSAVGTPTALPPDAAISASVVGNQLQLSAPASYVGVVTVPYTAGDSNGATAPGFATITITPNALPLPPVALPDVATLNQDDGATLINVLANDLDASGTGLTLSSVSSLVSLPVATHTVGISGNQLQFTPAAGFAGVATLSYTVTTGEGQTATGLVTITVTPALPLIPPVALPDVVTHSSSAGTLDIDVLANDLNPGGGTLSLTTANVVLTVPVNLLIPNAGSVSIVNNQVRYVPNAGFAGVVTINYSATAANGLSTPGVLTLTVLP